MRAFNSRTFTDRWRLSSDQHGRALDSGVLVLAMLIIRSMIERMRSTKIHYIVKEY